LVAFDRSRLALAISDTGREFADALERMPGGEDHRKKRPADLHLARQINAVHDAAKADVSEDRGDLTPADQQGCKRRFRAFALEGVYLFFEQRRHQAAEFASSSTINTARRFCCACPMARLLP
jgi:hypothetical protein